MKVATWNLDYRNTDEIRGHMRSRPADVWVLTETRATISPCNDDYKRIVCSPPHGLRNGRPDGCFVAIWVRRDCLTAGWKVTNVPVLLAHALRMACVRIKQPGRRDITVVGTVLPWRSDPQWSGAVGFCAALAAQEVEWHHLWADPTAGFCVAGDFNQSLPFVHPYGTKLGAAALSNTLDSPSHRLRCLTGYEHDPRLLVANNTPSIDHICVSDALQQVGPVDCWSEERYINGPNGHAGVLAELQIH